MMWALCNMGGVKCQPFLKHNHWKRTIKFIFKGSVYFQFPETVVTCDAKKSLRSTKRGLQQVLVPHPTRTNFGSEGMHNML